MSIRTPEMAESILASISEGITLRDICRRGEISKSEVYRWLDDDKEFAGHFARARLQGFDAIAEETVSIADDGSNDWLETETGRKFDAEHVQRSKLRVDTRLKLLAKWDSGRYGDKTTTEVSGPGGTPLQIESIVRKIVRGTDNPNG